MSISPIRSLEELWTWIPKEEKPDTRPLRNYKTDKLSTCEPEIMVCHDMKGGYLPEETIEGVEVDNCYPYVFLNWWNIDLFCYFSHQFVTIPPQAYTDLGHDHGCIMMGTFITEWKDGKKICDQILESEETVERTVKALVDVADYYGFEGWLLNIENCIDKEHMDNLKYFVRFLTEEMRARIPFSRVIWYDSVIEGGKLHWQNELNLKNRDFYNSCDGIYLNYNWTDEMLLNSADFGQLSRIFVGVDVWARGCVGHYAYLFRLIPFLHRLLGLRQKPVKHYGKWECLRSFARAHFIRMSVALFAPGWICENFPHEDPIQNGLKFWNKLKTTTPSRKITELPIDTTFRTGFSTVEIDGNTKLWFRLNDIDLQPHFTSCDGIPGLSKSGLQFEKSGQHTIFELSVQKLNAVTIAVSSSEPVRILVNNTPVRTEFCKNQQVSSSTYELDGELLTAIGVITSNPNTIVHRIVISSI